MLLDSTEILRSRRRVQLFCNVTLKEIREKTDSRMEHAALASSGSARYTNWYTSYNSSDYNARVRARARNA